MSTNTLIFFYIFVTTTSVSVVLTEAKVSASATSGVAPKPAKPKASKPVVIVSCSSQDIGSKPRGEKIKNNDVTQECCQKHHGDCRKLEYDGQTFIYCLASSKSNERQLKKCCSSKKTTKTEKWTGGIRKDKNGDTYKGMEKCT